MASYQGKDFDGIRFIGDFSRASKRRDSGEDLSLRIPTWWSCVMRNLHSPMGRQKIKRCLQDQAAKNAITLFTMSAFFVLTWIIMVVMYVFLKRGY